MDECGGKEERRTDWFTAKSPFRYAGGPAPRTGKEGKRVFLKANVFRGKKKHN